MGVLFIDIDGIRDLAADLRRAEALLESLQRQGLGQLVRTGDANAGPFLAHTGEGRDILASTAADLTVRADGFAEAERVLSGSDTLPAPLPGEYCAAPPPQDIEPILERLRELLAEGGFWSFLGLGAKVSPQEVAETARILLDLPAHQLQAVLEYMDEETLTRWLSHASRAAAHPDQVRLFQLLAQTQPAPTLSRLLRAAPPPLADRLLEGVAGSPPARAIAVFQYWATHPAEEGWGPRLAAGLAGRMGFYALPALQWLAASGRWERFSASLLRSEVEFFTENPMHPKMFIYHDYHTGSVRSMARTLAELGDPDLSARFFTSAMKNLEVPLWQAAEVDGNFGQFMEVHNFDDRPALMGSLAGLLLSDPQGIFESLRLQYDIYGESARIFFREAHRPVTRTGRARDGAFSEWGAGATNRILAASLGPGLDLQSRAKYFQARTRTAGGSRDYANAARLGFIVGSVSRGLEDLQVNVQNQWQAVEIILGAAKVVDPTAVTSLIALGATAVTPVVEMAQAEQLAEMRAEQQDYEKALVESVLPRENGRIYDGDAADEFFNSYDRVGGEVQPSGAWDPDNLEVPGDD